MIREYKIEKNWEKTVVISFLGADPSAAGYGMALLSVPLVWDAVKLSDTALCTLFDGIRDRDSVYRGNMPLGAMIAAKMGHMILSYYKCACEYSLKTAGSNECPWTPKTGTDFMLYWNVGNKRWLCWVVQKPEDERQGKMLLFRSSEKNGPIICLMLPYYGWQLY